jgi:hypothetical protein
LIEKFNQDLFERYELIRDQKENNYFYHITKQKDINQTPQPPQSQFHQYQSQTPTRVQSNDGVFSSSASSLSSSASTNSSSLLGTLTNNTTNSTSQVNYNYYYYDTQHKNLMNINTITIDSPYLPSTTPTTIKTTTHHRMTANATNKDDIHYPLSFIDAVNRKQLDLESGLFKDSPKKTTFTLSLGDAIHLNLLNPTTAYIADTTQNRSTDLKESIRLGLITNKNRVCIKSPSSPLKQHVLTLADALKLGHLKIGEPFHFNNLNKSNNNNSLNASGTNSSCSISSETQSMSVRSIRDPSTGEFLVPTDAIKRQLLDPYKGLFINPQSGEHMPISEAIQKGKLTLLFSRKV